MEGRFDQAHAAAAALAAAVGKAEVWTEAAEEAETQTPRGEVVMAKVSLRSSRVGRRRWRWSTRERGNGRRSVA